MRKDAFRILPLMTLLLIFALNACSPKFNLLPDPRAPFKEVTLKGEGSDKILLVPIRGVISAAPPRSIFVQRPSVVEEVVGALDLARKDENIKAVMLRIDTPGGSATASDILNEEIKRFKQETGKKVITHMMGLSTSGGYYTAVASDYIIAHPTTITGSVGVIFIKANLAGLMDKIGVQATAIKSGEHKDMGSPFRDMSEAEIALFNKLIDTMQKRFVAAVKEGRKQMSEADFEKIADGRIVTAEEALTLKMIDEIGYTKDAFEKAKALAKTSKDARLVVYRRNPPTGKDSVYNMSQSSDKPATLLDVAGLNALNIIPTSGFYYIWEPGLAQ